MTPLEPGASEALEWEQATTSALSGRPLSATVLEVHNLAKYY